MILASIAKMVCYSRSVFGYLFANGAFTIEDPKRISVITVFTGITQFIISALKIFLQRFSVNRTAF